MELPRVLRKLAHRHSMPRARRTSPRAQWLLSTLDSSTPAVPFQHARRFIKEQLAASARATTVAEECFANLRTVSGRVGWVLS